ncbi:MAG: leucine-rich repeat protein [Prevotella sp.]|nr:leucine-rich repeat protein [Prevotella sp.]
MIRKTTLLIATLFAVMVQTAVAQLPMKGSGTEADPYILASASDWYYMNFSNKNGDSFAGKFIRMTADINVYSVSVGTEDTPFSGTLDGGGHTLTYNAGTFTDGNVTPADKRCAPFLYVSGANISHLRTTGRIATSKQYAGGVISMVQGPGVTTLTDVQSDMYITGYSVENAAHGGLVGAVNAGGLTIERGVFQGFFDAENSGGLVGWSNVDVTIRGSMVSPEDGMFVNGAATFARMAGGTKLTVTDSYFTRALEQGGHSPYGEGVFNRIALPEGCTYEMVSEPSLQYGGVSYWKSGAQVRLTAPADASFDHWDTGIANRCYVSDPWTRDGVHTLRDIVGLPVINIATAMPTARLERTMDGTRYRYLTRNDYHLYLSDEECARQGYEFEGSDLSSYLIRRVDGSKCYITVVTGWVEGEIPTDGLQIHNDLSGVFHDYTLLAAIAPHAFQGCTGLKTVYFKDSDANNYNAQAPFSFKIGEMAFADCPNLSEVKMMQYTTEGDNEWRMMEPAQVTEVAQNAFTGSPDYHVSCHRNVYQSFLDSETWRPVWNRIVVYDATVEDFNIDGVRYHQYRNKNETSVLTNQNKDQMMDNHVRIWAADYQEFNPADLLNAFDESQNIYYTSVVGLDDDYLRSHDGHVSILNDLGTYHNYKTICLTRSAMAGNENLRSIDFRQVNGDQTSRSDLKMVIQNGAFKGCKNLRELRMYYFCEDGDDHWETLGPKDVIPGDNIFGMPSPEEFDAMTEEQRQNFVNPIPEGFKILVSTSRMTEFMLDPNWSNYLGYIEPVEFEPTDQKSDFTMSKQPGITYGYMANPGGVLETSQTVSQDVSWWTAVRIAYEIAKEILTYGLTTYTEPVVAGAENNVLTNAEILTLRGLTSQIANDTETETIFDLVEKSPLRAKLQQLIEQQLTALEADHVWETSFAGFTTWGLINEEGAWIGNLASFEKIISKFGESGPLNFKMTLKKVINHVLEQNVYIPSHLVDKLLTKGGAAALSFAASHAAGYMASKYWGSGNYNYELMKKGMRENILSNIHQVGIVGGGYVYTVPTKNLAYHTYIKKVDDDVTRAVIYAGTDKGQGGNANTVTTAIDKRAFRDHKQLTHVSFFENNVTTNEAVPMVLAIPDSAFVGCDNLTELRLLLETDGHGTQAMGPESFILGGDSIFAGLSPEKFHIVIDPSRKQDFLDNESWKPLEKYFVYETAQPKDEYNEYGGKYAYAYENGSVQKVHKVLGHKIEHTVVTGPTTESGEYLLAKHQGALKLCNDIGEYNNYQLDAVKAGAFKGCDDLRVVYFTDLYGSGAFGDSYTGLDVTLEDSCFAHCKNLADVDLLYMVTDGDNRIDPITPQQLKLGRGVLDGTTARLKMMPQQVAWFEADTTWNKLRDRFMPCVIKPGDEGVRKALKKMAYYDMAATGYDPDYWTDYIDLARIAGAGFSWLDGKFTEYKDDILSFADFKYFESVGLSYVGNDWFRGCAKMSNITLPETIKTIGENAFDGCGKLQEIVLPATVNTICNRAFTNCSLLKTIVVRSESPALIGDDAFTKNDGLRIYVPAAKVDIYKRAWADYAQYIVADNGEHTKKVVTLSKSGTLAEELGLYWEWSYSGMIAGDEPRYLHGNYSRYDSLTVNGPLNDLDLATLRYLAGADSYSRGGGAATDGRLRFLNLYGASIVKDSESKAHYVNHSSGMDVDWRDIKADNVLPRYLFSNCTALESVVLPRSIKSMDGFIFEGCSALKRVCITGSIDNYNVADYNYFIKGILSYPLEELVFYTDQPAVSTNSDPWGQPISMVFTKQSQVADYMGQANLVRQAQNIIAPFEEEAVLDLMFQKGLFFPGEYLQRENVEGLFNYDTSIRNFDDFARFANVKELDQTFFDAWINSVTLPTSIEKIGTNAFVGCNWLSTIRINCDSVPELGNDAFRNLPADFRILVPKTLCKLYRTKWPQYADHINPDNTLNSGDDIITVELTEPNTLAAKLGLTVTTDSKSSVWAHDYQYVTGIRGDYSNVHRLKVVGPISGQDLSVLRYLAGFCAWANTRNYAGPLEYIDLYDAQLKASDFAVASDMFWKTTRVVKVDDDDVLPAYSFLQAYNLKTLILPRTCKEVRSRALQQCEALEVLVVGDKTTDFNWSALDDDAMLSRMYLLCEKKPEIDMDSWAWRNLCNNYHPTFDAFYVRPSLYKQYLSDPAYTTDTWQRTNNISMGEFADDEESFCAFASHAAATADDLASVTSVDRWFDNYTGIRDLTPLRFTSITELTRATIEPLTKLEKIALPTWLTTVEDGTFSRAASLLYADFTMSQEEALSDDLRDGGLQRIGLDTERTLVYVPELYGESDETNVVVARQDGMKAKAFRLQDGHDYYVPYAFETDRVESTRQMPQKGSLCTSCLPFDMAVPDGVRAYYLDRREGTEFIFKEVSKMEALKPYVLKTTADNASLANDGTTTVHAMGTNIFGHQVDILGYAVRGTFKAVSNDDARDMHAYILQRDFRWYPVPEGVDDASILPYRVYLLERGGWDARGLSLRLEDADATAVDTLRTVGSDGTEQRYDLQGRPVDDNARGIIISNGKKHINK